ncbi:Saccharopine dehydrogenase-domain-containing protein [Crepidotus variabilis]|uniref:Saccharopine dehydrogenase-domain-containing protein n=1 Tax=Crepidotus variabilis TaxID=179855 RepID=A0A9P6EJ89_9AGAR|nr:Saccharopine dehydrogenase-domain-containing protein [Crepidotus variabilis]
MISDQGGAKGGQGVPEGLGPFVVGVSGTGNVSQGALDMLHELPITKVGVEDLEGLVLSSNWDRHTIYLVHAKPQDYLFRTDKKGRYERKDYYENPGCYESLFWEKVAPYLTLFINGAGWAPGFPRLMSNVQLAQTLEVVKKRGLRGFRFENVADVSCDVEGGLEYLSRATTLSAPFYDIDVNSLITSSNLPISANTSSRDFPSVRMMSVDILPASMPLDASKHFSKALRPYLRDLVGEYTFRGSLTRKRGYGDVDLDLAGYEGRYTEALRKATIAQGGMLRGEWKGLLWEGVREFAGAPFGGAIESARKAEMKALEDKDKDKVAAKEEEDHPHVKTSVKAGGATSGGGGRGGVGEKKRVLLLGSGMVAQPAVDYLVAKLGVKLVIASNSPYELDNLSRPYKTLGDVETVQMEFDDPRKYEHLVRDADVVVSLLPAFMHVNVAKVCIDAGKHLVTASYMSPEMEALNEKAENANTLILTEIGLDPGIDHLSAMSMIDDLVGQKRKRLLSFISMCGGLPAPEDSIGVPLRYKFSWRPEGVLTAALEGAKWLLWKENHEIPGTELLKNYWSGLPITKEFELEGLPNRDSETYRKLYNLSGMRTFVRGTLRYPGYSSLMSSFVSLGLLNNQKKMKLEGWNTFVRQAMVLQYEQDVQKSCGVLPSLPSLLSASAKGNGVGVTKEQEQERFEQLREALEWLGLALPGMQHAKDMAMPPLPKGPQTPLSIFAYLLAEKLRYASGEKDMVVLSHEIVADDIFKLRAGEGADKKAIPAEEEVHTSTLITYATDRMHVGFQGERPASAMARTVGLPAAVAAGLIVYGKIGGRGGVIRPIHKDVYVPVLKELGDMGLEMDEKVRVVKKLEESSGTVEYCLARNMEGEKELGRKIEAERDMDDDPSWVEEESVSWAGDNSSRRKSFIT